MSSQREAAQALADMLGDYPDLDGRVSATIDPHGSRLHVMVTRRIGVDSRDRTLARLCDIIGVRPRVTLQRAPGRGAWREAQGVYKGIRVDVSAHYTDEEAELLHVAAERALDAAPSAHFSIDVDGTVHQNVDIALPD